MRFYYDLVRLKRGTDIATPSFDSAHPMFQGFDSPSTAQAMIPTLYAVRIAMVTTFENSDGIITSQFYQCANGEIYGIALVYVSESIAVDEYK